MIEAAPAGGKDGGPSLSRGVGPPLRGTEAGIFYDARRSRKIFSIQAFWCGGAAASASPMMRRRVHSMTVFHCALMESVRSTVGKIAKKSLTS